MQVDGVQDRAPYVVLLLRIGGIADPHRPRSLVTAEVVDRALSELALTADAVHNLQVLFTRGDVCDEVEEIVGLARETKRVEAPEHEGAVADPGVSVVPVALAADRLRQRRGGGREQGAGRAIGEALEGQSAPLKEALPGVLWKLAAVDPLAPEVRGALCASERLIRIRRRRMLGPELVGRRVLRARPRQGDVRLLTLPQRLGRVRAGPLESHA